MRDNTQEGKKFKTKQEVGHKSKCGMVNGWFHDTNQTNDASAAMHLMPEQFRWDKTGEVTGVCV